jgi:predicted lipoprotein with Yx(FWY)xxD motif
MRRITVIAISAVAAAAAALALAACGSGGSGSSPAGGSAATVTAHSVSGIGTVLADSTGRTLYFADQESGSTIQCTGECARVWIPLAVSAGTTPTAGTGVDGTLATLTRPDGLVQVTYNGKPLYTFSFDSSAGDTSGNGVSDAFGGMSFVWHAATASGAASSPSAPSSPYSPGARYQY